MRTKIILLILIMLLKSCSPEQADSSLWIGKLFDNTSIIIEIGQEKAIVTSITSNDWNSIDKDSDTLLIHSQKGDFVFNTGDLQFKTKLSALTSSNDSIACKVIQLDKEITFFSIKASKEISEYDLQNAMINESFDVFNWLHEDTFRFDFLPHNQMLFHWSDSTYRYYQVYHWSIQHFINKQKLIIIAGANSIELYPVKGLDKKEIRLISTLGNRLEEISWGKYVVKSKGKQIQDLLVGEWNLKNVENLEQVPPSLNDQDPKPFISYNFASNGKYESMISNKTMQGFWTIAGRQDLVILSRTIDSKFNNRRNLFLIEHIDLTSLLIRQEFNWPFGATRNFYSLSFTRKTTPNKM